MKVDQWTKTSWKNYNILQQPEWPDPTKYQKILDELTTLPSLVFSGETRNLISDLKKVNANEKFILQIGNCAESFSDCNGPKIHNFLRVLLQMSIVINYNTKKSVVQIGRIAGQYAKPRSSNLETVNGLELTSYKGDNVNDFSPTIEARTPNPERLLEGYFRSAATLNLIRAFTQGHYNDIQNLNDWKQHLFFKQTTNFKQYSDLINEIETSLQGLNEKPSFFKPTNLIYTSHEALLLDYETVFTRLDTTFEGYYNTSAHFLWVGERTRQTNSAHVELLSGIGNPVGLKIGPDYNLQEIIEVVKKLNPKNQEGKLILIVRMGKLHIKKKLDPLIKSIKKKGVNVTWMSDPMHGNTYTYKGYKVRAFDDIVSEIKSFFEICKLNDVIPGGVHLELTEENVTECIGGLGGTSTEKIGENYFTKVDPRLNAAQALEIAFIISELINETNK